MAKGKKIALGCLTVFVVAAPIIYFSPFGDAIRDILKTGVLEENKAFNREFQGDSIVRLKAMYTAADLYHQSEDKFPEAAEWMSDLLPRLKTDDLKAGEAEKKLIRPDLQKDPYKYGYALNSAVAGKYRDDIKEKDSILIYESIDTKKDAVGDPKTDGIVGGKGITIAGNIVDLKR